MTNWFLPHPEQQNTIHYFPKEKEQPENHLPSISHNNVNNN